MCVWVSVFALGFIIGGSTAAFAFMTTHYHPEK